MKHRKKNVRKRFNKAFSLFHRTDMVFFDTITGKFIFYIKENNVIIPRRMFDKELCAYLKSRFGLKKEEHLFWWYNE